MSIVYNSFNYVYEVYETTYVWLSDWIGYYVYGQPQIPKITYTGCFECHSPNVIDPNSSINNVKSRYCQECYQNLVHEAMDTLIQSMM